MQKRKDHIIKNMIYLIEYNRDNITIKERFGKDVNVIVVLLNWEPNIEFDFVIGNPPYNCNGVKKVPTKSNVDKKQDGKTIWTEFIKKNISIFKNNGIMNY